MSGLQIQHQRNYHVLRWALALTLFAALAGYAYFGIRWYNTGELSPLPLPVAATDTSIDERDVSESAIQDYRVKSDEPRYIEIPKIGLGTSRIERIGLTDRQMLDVPKHISDAGWYAKSAKPGSGVGAVLMNGHVEGSSTDGVFARLASLLPGDQVTVERGDGKRFVYEIVDVREKSVEWVNRSGMKEMMFSVDPSKEGLSLIADAGKWVPRDKSYDKRTLVRATIVD